MESNNQEWYQKILYSISHDQDVLDNLSNLRIALSGLNFLRLKYLSSSLDLSCIFDCVNSSNKNQIELSCEILKTFLSALDPSTAINQYGIAMLRLLKHPSVEVKDLVLLELNRAVCESDLAPRLCGEKELLLSVVRCVADEETSVARKAIKFLTRLGTSTPGLEALYSPPMLQVLSEISNTNDTNRFRIYEIAVEVSVNSEPGLEASHSCCILEKLVQELKSDDTLALLTTLEFVTKLALTYQGFKYLESNNIVHHLAHQLAHIADDPLGSLVLPGLIKFFGNIAQQRPQETFQGYPKAIDVIVDSIDSSDCTMACVALETIGYIATTTAGKHTLHKQGPIMKNVMSKIWEVSTKWQTESRIRGLNTLANIIKLELSEQDTETLSMVEGWFNSMAEGGRSVMTKVMEMIQQPFPEMKLAALLVLQEIAEQPWGQQYVNDTPGLIELLLDRSGDSSMQEKAARFAVVSVIADSPTAEAVFGEDVVKRFRNYTREGAVYVPLQTEVAIEKAD